jgi:LPPG:FO 2-phospho-L-lactate transferase
VLALAGGVGGAKLALGLARILPADQLAVVVNTGDDECFHGLHVSPDLDTVMYTLAGLANPETGWGLAGDTFNSLPMLRRLGADVWFNLGDQDLATHVRRTQLLKEGETLSQVTAALSRALGVGPQIVPMSDDPVRTVISTEQGHLPMQDYFVRRRAEPVATGIAYTGASTAKPAAGFLDAINRASLMVLCPSNPFLSLGPILALPGVRRYLETFKGPRAAVSPIVAGAALRGPAAKIMAELGEDASCLGVARQYAGLCDYFLIDHQDAAMVPAIEDLGMKAVVTSIIMTTDDDKKALAQEILDLTGGST